MADRRPVDPVQFALADPDLAAAYETIARLPDAGQVRCRRCGHEHWVPLRNGAVPLDAMERMRRHLATHEQEAKCPTTPTPPSTR